MNRHESASYDHGFKKELTSASTDSICPYYSLLAPCMEHLNGRVARLCNGVDRSYKIPPETPFLTPQNQRPVFIDPASATAPRGTEVRKNLIQRLGAALQSDPRWIGYWAECRIARFNDLPRTEGDMQLFTSPD